MLFFKIKMHYRKCLKLNQSLVVTVTSSNPLDIQAIFASSFIIIFGSNFSKFCEAYAKYQNRLRSKGISLAN